MLIQLGKVSVNGTAAALERWRRTHRCSCSMVERATKANRILAKVPHSLAGTRAGRRNRVGAVDFDMATGNAWSGEIHLWLCKSPR